VFVKYVHRPAHPLLGPVQHLLTILDGEEDEKRERDEAGGSEQGSKRGDHPPRGKKG
jgi:hypothetical protein